MGLDKRRTLATETDSGSTAFGFKDRSVCAQEPESSYPDRVKIGKWFDPASETSEGDARSKESVASANLGCRPFGLTVHSISPSRFGILRPGSRRRRVSRCRRRPRPLLVLERGHATGGNRAPTACDEGSRYSFSSFPSSIWNGRAVRPRGIGILPVGNLFRQGQIRVGDLPAIGPESHSLRRVQLAERVCRGKGAQGRPGRNPAGAT